MQEPRCLRDVPLALLALVPWGLVTPLSSLTVSTESSLTDTCPLGPHSPGDSAMWSVKGSPVQAWFP